MKQLLRACVMLSLAGTVTTAVAQGALPLCNALPAGERASAQAIGACRESAPVVDVTPKGAAGAVGQVPQVVGLSFDDARSRLSNFTVRRSYVASAEPGGTVLQQQPAPLARLGAGGIVRLVVSDGSLRPPPQVSDAEIDGVRKTVEPPALASVPKPIGASQNAPSGVARSSAVDVRKRAAVSNPVSTARGNPSETRTASTKAGQVPPRSAVARSTPRATETLELPNVVGRTSADASAALAEFKVDRVEIIANAAPSGQVLAQDPAPGTQVPVGTSIGLQVSDGSLASVGTTASPVTSTVEPSPASTVAPSPPPTVSPSSPPERAAAARTARAPMTFPSTAVLLLIVGVLVGLGLGALLMRNWLAKRHAADTDAWLPASAPPPVELVKHQPVAKAAEQVALSQSAMAAGPITFAARLEEGETTIEFAAPSDADEMTLEYSRDFHE